MLIISKKKDYYDGVVGTMGIDKTIVYDREIIGVEEKNRPAIFKHQPYKRRREFTPFINIGGNIIKKEYRNDVKYYSYFIIGFCGKLYIGYKFYNDNGSKLNISITYDIDIANKIIEPKGFYCDMTNDYNYIKNYNTLDLFRELKTPIFVYDNDYNRTELPKYHYAKRKDEKFFINPILKDYEFYKIFDSFQAFQEIQMFLGGVLGMGEKEIIQVADKYKIEQHGFDKHSFRKDKEIK